MAIQLSQQAQKFASTAKATLRNPRVAVGVAVLLFVIGLATIGPHLTPYKTIQLTSQISSPPSWKHPFGTDEFGDDIYAQVAYGTGISLIVGFIAAIIGSFIGIMIGFFAAYKGGMVDELLMFVTNMFLVIPSIAILLILAALLPYSWRTIWTEAVIIGIFNWPWAARALRSQVMSLKAREFVLVAKMSGLKSSTIMFHEILPNMLAYVILNFMFQFSGAILSEVTLDFLGLGAPNSYSLGWVLNQAFQWNAVQAGWWWWPGFPGIIVTALFVSLYLMPTGLEQILNPRLRVR
jgi:peptide/nickel transport system permease protein